VGLAPELGELHGVEELLGGVGDEAEIVNEEEDDDVDVEMGGGRAEVRETALEGADEVSNVEAQRRGERRPPSVRPLRISTKESEGL